VFRMRQKLGTQRKASRWLAAQSWETRSQKRPWLGLILKDLAQSGRNNPLGRLWNWLPVFLISAGLVLSTGLRAQDWALSAILLVYWSLQMGNQATKRLQDDLALWSVLRPLPLHHWDLVAAEITRAWIEASLVNWLGLALGLGIFGVLQTASAAVQGPLPAPQPLLQPGGSLILFLLVPILAMLAIFGASLDVLRQSKSSNLLSGYAPQPGVLSLVLGGGAALISAGLALGLAAANVWLALLAPVVGALIAGIYWRLAAQRYGGIK
jgi:hypothetical protein